MKKTAKFLSLAIALLAGTGTTLQAAGFEGGVAGVTSYVWRGTEYGNSPAIQPYASYTFDFADIKVGAWGNYAVTEYTNADGEKDRFQEIDLYVTVPVGPVDFTITDYNTNHNLRAFDFGDNGPNVVELSASTSYEDFSLMGAYNIAGSGGRAIYCEAGYQFYDNDGYTASGFVGAGNDSYYRGSRGDSFAVVNTGISVSKEFLTASYIYNPDNNKTWFVLTAAYNL